MRAGGRPSSAPSSPPLSSGAAETSTESGEAPGSSAPQVGADPLVSNGLGSPLCKGALGAGALSSTSNSNCETSGFVAAGAPTEDYAIDVHIDTGVLGISSGGLLSVVQDLFVTPLWMALVWAVHALVVMLEWCFTIDLLDSPAAGGVGSGLRHMQSAFTEPWLATALAVAAVLALYGGLVRRRVADTVGQALAMGAMFAGGMWVIADPAGTVGALGGWANQASLGTLAVSARGSPADPGRTLGDSMQTLFAAVIEVPWCYLEFGDVDWCRNPARLDPRVHAAGLAIAAEEIVLARCKPALSGVPACASPGSAQALALEHGATLLRGARSNGAVFLALPANGPTRNSINQQGSLLRTICESSEATRCRGPTSMQAEFRTDRGTWARVGGLLLILAGALGMILLFGFIAMRLLSAAIFSLLYLLLAPAIVLAPALGERGRAVFRSWATHLLAAVLSKLIFSFLLGVLLAVLAILASLQAFGWWTQWLLMSAFWWGAYSRRHQAMGLAGGAFGREQAGARRLRGGGLRRALETPFAAGRAASRAKAALSKPAPEIRHGKRLAGVQSQPRHENADEQVSRTLEHDRREARRRVRATPEIQQRLSVGRARLERLQAEHGRALTAGDTRRAAELHHRARRIEGEIENEERQLAVAQRIAREDDEMRPGRSGEHARTQEQNRRIFLDVQMSLPGSADAVGSRARLRRDYPALASLAGLGRREYEQLSSSGQRLARMETDRELDLRKRIQQAAAAWGRDGGPDRGFEGLLREPPRPDGSAAPPAPEIESTVMHDAREVLARRKRQLGLGRP
jgi:hypothetical protein